MNLIYEALARARMRQPQTANSEALADHSAKRIAMRSRQNQARDLGHLPLR